MRYILKTVGEIDNFIIEKEMKKNGLAVTENGDKSPIPSKFIIHVDTSGGHYKKKILEVMNKVEDLKLKTVAIPAIGTGINIFSCSSCLYIIVVMWCLCLC